MELTVKDMVKWFVLTNEKIQENKDYLTSLDQPIGDGDHGINMARGYHAVVEKLNSKAYSEPSEVIKDVSITLLSKVGGASGPLYGTAFLKMSMVLKGHQVIDVELLANGLEAAVVGLKQRGKSEAFEKTLVDVWSPITAYVSTGEISSDGLLDTAKIAMEEAKEIMATKGRAAYFKEKSIGHIDPGTASSYYIFAALADVLKEKV